MDAETSGEGAETERYHCLPDFAASEPCGWCADDEAARCKEGEKLSLDETNRTVQTPEARSEPTPGVVEELADLIHTGTADLSWDTCMRIARNACDAGLLRDPEDADYREGWGEGYEQGYEQGYDAGCKSSEDRNESAAEAREAKLRERIGKMCDESDSANDAEWRCGVCDMPFVHVYQLRALLDETEPTDG